MSYAVINPATGETLETFDTISDAELRGSDRRRRRRAPRTWSRSTTVAERAALDPPRRRAARGAPRGARRRSSCARWASRVEQALGEVDFAAAIYEYYADHADEFLEDEPIELLDGEGTAVIRRSSLGRAARHHAVELPVLPGRPVRRPEPRHRQHDPAQARAAVPGVGGRDRADLPRRRASPRAPTSTSTRPTTRSTTVIADPRVQGVSLTGSERAGAAVAEIAGPQPEEGRARARRLRPVHPALAPTTWTRAVQDAVDARLDNTGQSCNAAKRFIVIDDLYEAFVEKFTAALAAVEAGDPTSPTTPCSARSRR